MVRKTKQKPKKKTLIITAICLVVSTVTLLAILEFTGATNLLHDDIQSSKEQQEAAKADQAKKKSVTDKDTSSTGNDKTDQTNTIYSPPNSPDNLVLDVKQDASNVIVTTRLYKYSDGSCALHIANGSKAYEATAPVIFASDFASCAGFSIPTSSLGAGVWTLNLDVTSGGTTQTQSASLEVR